MQYRRPDPFPLLNADSGILDDFAPLRQLGADCMQVGASLRTPTRAIACAECLDVPLAFDVGVPLSPQPTKRHFF